MSAPTETKKTELKMRIQISVKRDCEKDLSS